MKKITLLSILSILFFVTRPCSAYNSQNIINFIYELYKEELGMGFLKKDYEIKNHKARKKILAYMQKKEHPQDNDWNKYVVKNYESEEKLSALLEKSYDNISRIKNKYHEDQLLTSFFESNIKQKLENDINQRKELINQVINTQISNEEKIASERQLALILKQNDINELGKKYKLSKDDIDFLITSNLLLEKNSKKVYNKELNKRVFNLTENTNYSKEEAKKILLKNYTNKSKYIF